MDLSLQGRSALVTGASQGIGHAVARELAAEGCRLAITARRGALLNKLADAIAAGGAPRPLVIEADLSRPEGPPHIAGRALEALGTVEILVNNAGASAPMPLDAPDEAWQEAMALNFEMLRRLTMRLLPGMQARGWGRIINVTGMVEPRALNAAVVAKAAAQAWTKGLSCDVARDGITVNSIAPGRLNTEQILTRLHPDPEQRKAYIEANIPIGYFGEPEDLAPLVAFLASPRARYITGELIHVDGGMRRFAF